MGMFHNLMGKIFAHAATPTQPASAPAAAVTPADPAPAAGSPLAPAEDVTAAPVPLAPDAQAAPVDVAAILNGLAAKNPEKLDWQRSIVDMLKLLGMDSSLSARKELAQDLSYPGDESNSAAMNEWLHKTVLNKLAENGGKVPAELLT